MTNNASMGEINLHPNGGIATNNNAYIPKIPNLPENNNNSGLGGGVFTSGKGSVIKRDSIVFKGPSDNGGGSSNFRNN